MNDVFPASKEINNRIEPTNKIFSVVNIIGFLFLVWKDTKKQAKSIKIYQKTLLVNRNKTLLVFANDNYLFSSGNRNPKNGSFI